MHIVAFYENMSTAELEEKLSMLKDDLEDVEDERDAVLGQTGIHLSGGAVKQYEVQIDAINKRIMVIKEILQKK